MSTASDDDRRYQPDRRKLDEDTISFRTSVSGQLDSFGEELHNGNHRFEALESHIEQLKHDLAANSEATAKVMQTVTELMVKVGTLIEVFNSLMGGFQVLEWLGRLAKPLTAIVLMVVAVAAAWKQLG